MPKHNTYVVKFGGSVAGGPCFGAWVQKLIEWSETRIVYVVPGGGVFADAVRRLQQEAGYDDVVAHELALMSMRQIGMVIRGCSDETFQWSSLAGMEDENDIAGPVLWVPNAEEFAFSALPKDWSVSSDSIALWLAEHIDASELVLLKSAPQPQMPVEEWTKAGYVDRHFNVLLRQTSRQIRAVSALGEL